MHHELHVRIMAQLTLTGYRSGLTDERSALTRYRSGLTDERWLTGHRSGLTDDPSTVRGRLRRRHSLTRFRPERVLSFMGAAKAMPDNKHASTLSPFWHGGYPPAVSGLFATSQRESTAL